jgi:spore maturation protein CgeB
MADIVILGLSITSSWGNGHATTWRALVKALAQRGHRILFLERDVPWYADSRDLQSWPHCEIQLYHGLQDLNDRFGARVAEADAVIVGSYVPDGIAIGDWAIGKAAGTTAFYDIDTPITLGALERGDCAYLSVAQLPSYDVYLTFTGGPALQRIEKMGSPLVAPLYCSVDPEVHAPMPTRLRWDLGYLGTYSADRQPALEEMLLSPARAHIGRRFAVAGSQYPEAVTWPDNVTYIAHLPPGEHPWFYCAQRFALNLTRADMRAAGYSPSVRLFEAAACGVPVITDAWPGLEDFFAPGEEILVAGTRDEVLDILENTTLERRDQIGQAARRHVLAHHTAMHRAAELEALLHTNTAGLSHRTKFANA